MYKLRNWIPEEKLDNYYLQYNHHSGILPYLENNPDAINWNILSANPAAIHLLEENLDKVNWWRLSMNPAAIHLLETNLDKVDWEMLSTNPGAIDILKQNPEKIEWSFLFENPSANLFLDNIERHSYWIHWDMDILSANPCLITFLEKNQDKLSWTALSRNPAAIHLLEANLDKVRWYSLAKNPAAIDLIKRALTGTEDLIPDIQHQDGMSLKEYCWKCLSMNPSIFQYDYQAMKRSRVYKEELMEKIFHPRNYHRFASWGFDEFEKFGVDEEFEADEEH